MLQAQFVTPHQLVDKVLPLHQTTDCSHHCTFTTSADTTAPKLVSIKQGTTDLTSGIYNVGATTNIVLTFDEAVQFNAGTIFTF